MALIVEEILQRVTLTFLEEQQTETASSGRTMDKQKTTLQEGYNIWQTCKKRPLFQQEF